MTTRIASLAANNHLLSFMFSTQQRLKDLEIQVASEKVSQDYAGISNQSQRLLDLENKRDVLERFNTNNELMDLRLKTADTVVEGVEKTIRDFREQLYTFEQGLNSEEQAVRDIQDAAFRALVSIETLLNTDVDGRYIFAGGRVQTQPVDLGLSTVTAFQTQFDGDAVVFPPTRAANAETNVSLTQADTGNLTITGTDTITAATANSLAGIAVGSTITLGGSVLGNDDTYTVVSNTGTAITIAGTLTAGATNITVTNAVANGTETAATIAAASYYNGDTLTQTHRVDGTQTFTLDIDGIDPAFEKAIRAMGNIAQGAFGTNGGLDSHPERVDQSLYLLNSALELPEASLTPPFGTELTSNTSQILQDLGYDRVLIDQTNRRHEELIVFFEQQIASTENVDSLEAVTRLLDDQRALEASFQVLSRVRALSLTNFL